VLEQGERVPSTSEDACTGGRGRHGRVLPRVIHRRTWKTREAVELATLTWVSWFNNHRLMGPLGDIPPAEAEAHYCRQLAEPSACAT
jgi:transposase InsO family protein